MNSDKLLPEDMVGIILSVSLFSDNSAGLHSHITFSEKLWVTYLYLMPLL
jgi:hypothetical protein